MARFLRGAAMLVIVGGLVATGWYFVEHSTGKSDTGRRVRGPVPVTVVVAKKGAIADRIEAVGTSRANESITVSAKVTEVVSEILFTEGQKVKKGAILVKLSDREQAAMLAKAQADLVAAEQQFARIRNLTKRGVVTSQQLEQATARRNVLNAEIDAIRARMADRVIRAPFDGVIGIRQVSPGTLIQPGTAITTLDDLSVIKVDFSVPETYLASLATGQEIDARVAAYEDRKFDGRIATISPRVDPVTRAVTVRAVLPNRDGLLRPGMLVVIEVIRNRRQAVLLPEEAVIPVRDRKFVYVVGAENRVRRVEVKIGARRPGTVEILSGILPGQRVVVEGTSRVSPGASVTVTRQKQAGKVRRPATL